MRSFRKGELELKISVTLKVVVMESLSEIPMRELHVETEISRGPGANSRAFDD